MIFLNKILQMLFPAGVLQLPFFSENQPMSLNFGHIGTFMGHEVSQQF
jgi:predicted metalloendopeptidase